ncbi:helix-turn-helix transcriptional regulator [Nocardia transvalensis]|uniref:helix-turn-helix transcriptional regulator n=1 Tax=Nocardia transvalensis TaxID=37333 RepID=UPI0018950F67|nr:WYL domain-containing protein [Nocardia transvalensis]MBF6328135.1 WYL domain-containing protein [Nocardia transvalensis]
MLESSARLLRLLSLLQTPREWSGAELADRLGVSARTVRRDIERLRELGYPVHAMQGTAGYRLAAGATLPPLLLDDEEALAVAVGLRTVTGGTVSGIEEASLRALAKLEQVLPSRLRHRLTALQRAMVRVGGTAPRVDPDVLIAIADSCHRRERLRFDYTDHRGHVSIRDTEPFAAVNFSRHWYLVAWDVDRGDWRSFRVDRLRPRRPTGPRFTPRELPGGDVVAYLSNRLSSEAWSWRATVVLHRSAAELAERIWPGMGVLEAVDDASCLLHLGADSPWALVWMITSIDTDFTVTEPPELVEAVRTLGTRCAAAVAS